MISDFSVLTESFKQFTRPPKNSGKMFNELSKKMRYRQLNSALYEVGYYGVSGKVAREHHFGNQEKGLKKRRLIGISSSDIDAVKEVLLESIMEDVQL